MILIRFIIIVIFSLVSFLSPAQNSFQKKGYFFTTGLTYTYVNSGISYGVSDEFLSHKNMIYTVDAFAKAHYFIWPKVVSVGLGFGTSVFVNPMEYHLPLITELRFHIIRDEFAFYTIFRPQFSVINIHPFGNGTYGDFGLGYEFNIGQKELMFEVCFRTTRTFLSGQTTNLETMIERNGVSFTLAYKILKYKNE